MTSLPTSTPSDGNTGLSDIKSGLPRSVNIPTNIWNNNLMSNTSFADDCFIYQKFSAKLQAYMIGYVNAIFSNYSVYQ
jgi:hypothetical protein